MKSLSSISTIRDSFKMTLKPSLYIDIFFCIKRSHEGVRGHPGKPWRNALAYPLGKLLLLGTLVNKISKTFFLPILMLRLKTLKIGFSLHSLFYFALVISDWSKYLVVLVDQGFPKTTACVPNATEAAQAACGCFLYRFTLLMKAKPPPLITLFLCPPQPLSCYNTHTRTHTHS